VIDKAEGEGINSAGKREMKSSPCDERPGRKNAGHSSLWEIVAGWGHRIFSKKVRTIVGLLEEPAKFLEHRLVNRGVFEPLSCLS